MVTLFLGLTLGWFVYAFARLVQEFYKSRRRVKKTLTVVLIDQAEKAEALVRRIIRDKDLLHPDMQVVLVDGGSVDDTPFILQRLAKIYGVAFRQDYISHFFSYFEGKKL